MATITKTFTENQVPNEGASKWTITVTGVDIVASEDTFTFTTPTIKVKYVGSNKGYGNAKGNITDFKIGGTKVPSSSSWGWIWYKPSKELAQTAMTSGTTYSLTKGTHYGIDGGDDYNAHTKTLSTSTFFNSGNKTSKSLNVTTAGYELKCGSAKTTSNTNYNWGYVSSSTGNLGTLATVTLNAPPTFNHTDIYYDKTYLYSGVTTASIDLSNISAKFGGDIVSATFKIGNDTKTLTGNITSGTLSVLLTTAGTFTPIVSVTDSRGQVTTEQLPDITVLDYKAPSISSLTLERTLNTGVKDEETGTYAVVDVTLAFSKELTDAKAPIVNVTDNNGTTLTSTVTWYSTRANNGALSGSVSWSSLPSGGRVYGLVSVTFGFSSKNSYQISVTPSDNISNGATITQTLGNAFYTIDFLAGGYGIAFGQPATDPGFYCDMPANFVDKSDTMRALFDFIHPVGSYYETSDTSFNPNVTWGGTWSLETAGQVHVSAGTGYSVAGALTNTSDGGAKTSATGSHKLTTDEIPAHTHGKETLTGYFSIRPYSASGGNIVGTNGIVSADSVSSTSYNGVSGASSGSKYQKITIDASHTHNSVGGSGTHSHGSVSTMQPYIVVNRWHRTA